MLHCYDLERFRRLALRFVLTFHMCPLSSPNNQHLDLITPQSIIDARPDCMLGQIIGEYGSLPLGHSLAEPRGVKQ